jgi:signal transduction histidine kinase
MRRLLPAGLRGRLLLAFVGTSALTLAVAAAVLLGPLRERLRDQSIENLHDAVSFARGDFQDALEDDPWNERFSFVDPSGALRERTDARVLVGNASLTRNVPGSEPPADAPEDWEPPKELGFLSDTEFGEPPLETTLVALRALRLEQTAMHISGDDVSIAMPLFVPEEDAAAGVLVAHRRLTEVATAAEQVRNALLAAAAAGLLVALALGIALSTTLLRRLARLRAVALRISAAGPDAPAPRDTGRDEVGDLARALARMQEELRRQEAARRSFVATASHELRTPLTMLQGTMELLEEDLRDGRLDIEDAQLQVTNARRELLRLSALAGELLDLSRLDAAVQLRSEPVELGELARAVAAEFHLRAHERDVTLAVVPPQDACWGRGDPDAIARVVRILIDNALRYGPYGEPVTLQATTAGGRAAITVTDRGPGIPPEEREHVFERFHRGRDTGSEGGFGLGLAIGRELAERMGGSLRLAERSEPGACFVLELPAVRTPSSAAPSPAPESDAPPAAGAARWR